MTILRLMTVRELKEGAILARDVFDHEGRILLRKGVSLNQRYILQMEEKGIINLYITDPEIDKELDIVEDVIGQETRVEARRALNQAIKNLKNSGLVITKQIHEAVNSIIDEIIGNRQALIQLTDLRSKKDNFVAHSVNVTVLSAIMGRALNYNSLQMKQLGIGAFFHDVGLELCTEDDLNSHCEKGFKVLKEIKEFSLFSAHVAFQHHENYDGSGYPRALKGEEIHEYARVVAIADAFDQLTGDEVLPPHEALALLIKDASKKYDLEILKLFIRHIALFPVGAIVKLNTGEIGVVIEVTFNAPSKPKVRILRDAYGEVLVGERVIDLLVNKEVFVAEVTGIFSIRCEE